MKYLLGLTAITCIVVTILSPPPLFASSRCAGVTTSYFSCPDGNNNPQSLSQTPFWKFMLTTLNIITSMIGIVAVGGIVYGALLYASAEDNESQTAKAKTIIRDIVIGLVVYMAMFAVAQYFIPGGIFS